MALGVLLGGSGLIGAGVQHLPAQLVFHGRVEDDRHVPDGAVMGLVVQSHAVGEMRGVHNTELLRFLIHQFHESFVGPGDIDSQSQGGIRSGGEDGTIQQLPDCDGLAQLIAYHAAIVDKAVVRDIDGDGNGIIQAFQVFSRNNQLMKDILFQCRT